MFLKLALRPCPGRTCEWHLDIRYRVDRSSTAAAAAAGRPITSLCGDESLAGCSIGAGIIISCSVRTKLPKRPRPLNWPSSSRSHGDSRHVHDARPPWCHPCGAVHRQLQIRGQPTEERGQRCPGCGRAVHQAGLFHGAGPGCDTQRHACCGAGVRRQAAQGRRGPVLLRGCVGDCQGCSRVPPTHRLFPQATAWRRRARTSSYRPVTRRRMR